jgi:preprotein translocase subunit YajC
VYGFIIILVLLAALWLLLIRPRQRQLRAQQRQISTLEVGDEIVTAGGLYGTVKRIDDDEVRVEIAPDLEVRIAKRAIAGITTEKQPELPAAAETEEEGRYPS